MSVGGSTAGPGLSASFAAIALLAMAACSGEKTVDTASIQTQIAKDASASRGVEVKVHCPGDVKAKKGGEFTCDATDGKGNSLPVHATQTDDRGHISWDLQAFNIPRVERELTKSVSQQIGAPVEVTCPAILADSHRGKQIACTVTDQQGRTGRVVATAVDDEGNVSWELNPESG